MRELQAYRYYCRRRPIYLVCTIKPSLCPTR